MVELARAIVLLCRVLEARGLIAPESEHAAELRSLYLTLLRRGESANDYHTRPRGIDNLRAYEEDSDVEEIFPLEEPRALPQKEEIR